MVACGLLTHGGVWLAYSWRHVACLLMVACGWQVLELFKAADKYDVPGLVKECVQIFRKITRSADVAPLLQVTCYSLLPPLLLPLQVDSKWAHAQLCVWDQLWHIAPAKLY